MHHPPTLSSISYPVQSCSLLSCPGPLLISTFHSCHSLPKPSLPYPITHPNPPHLYPG
jgi:hypothetical protein